MPDAEANFAVMLKQLPAGAIDSVRLVTGDIEQGRRVTVSNLAYRVYGGQRVAKVDLWIETLGQRRVVETLRVAAVGPDVAPGPRNP